VAIATKGSMIGVYQLSRNPGLKKTMKRTIIRKTAVSAGIKIRNLKRLFFR
jgi:hypothetical protein